MKLTVGQRVKFEIGMGEHDDHKVPVAGKSNITFGNEIPAEGVVIEIKDNLVLVGNRYAQWWVDASDLTAISSTKES